MISPIRLSALLASFALSACVAAPAAVESTAASSDEGMGERTDAKGHSLQAELASGGLDEPLTPSPASSEGSGCMLDAGCAAAE